MKRLMIRVSSLFKGFVLALIFSVFLQASLANGATELDQATFYSTITADILGGGGVSTGGSYVLTEGINIAGVNVTPTVFGTFTGTLDGNGYTISGLTKPLFDVISGDVSNLNLASGTGESGVIGNGALANTLWIDGTINNILFEGDVTGTDFVGGLVGASSGEISNSYATGAVTGSGDSVGGLVGYSDGTIANSYATGVVSGVSQVGGLVGESYGDISNSYATGVVTGSSDSVGGLVGYSDGTIANSYATGDVIGLDFVGGLVGYSYGDINIESYAAGTVTGLGSDDPGTDYYIEGSSVGGLVGYSDGTLTGEPHFEFGSFDRIGPVRNLLSIVNTDFAAPNLPFAVDPRINSGRPYLTSLIDSYVLASTFSLRSYYTQAAKSLDKALTPFGFKSNFSSHPNLGFQALEQNPSKLPAVIQLFEVSEYQNSNILLNKEDGLQLSISSYYKESVEIWTQGLDGEYLYLGLVEFDKDGKAILPTLKFDTANTYQLLMIKAADKLSEKPNLQAQLGQITINVI